VGFISPTLITNDLENVRLKIKNKSPRKRGYGRRFNVYNMLNTFLILAGVCPERRRLINITSNLEQLAEAL
jgi:hypothetical protein